ncbi:MAG: signal peptidase II [Chloroflexota bacterium]
MSPKPNRPASGGWWHLAFTLTTLLVVTADQLSKWWIRAHLADGQSLFQFGFFSFTRVHNTGAAFGLFRGYTSLLAVVALIGAALLIVYAYLSHHRFPRLDNSLSRFALGLVLGGTVGNLLDRLRLGSVTDFINIGIWPAFNLADSAIVVGVMILAYALLRMTHAENSPPKRGGEAKWTTPEH